MVANMDRWFDERVELRQDFLSRHGFSGAALSPVGQDCAFRRYWRVRSSGEPSFILMEAVPDDDERASPGHRLMDFIRIADFLTARGIHVPAVMQADEAQGFLLLEDLGDESFLKALGRGESVEMLYALGVDVLRSFRGFESAALPKLPSYYDSHVHQGRVRLVDWFLPLMRGAVLSGSERASYLEMWESVEAALPPCPQGFIHIDFHAENLMYCPEKEGLARCGVLDFQGAMRGPVVYDLANLLEDARRDVSEDVRREMLARYVEGVSVEDAEILKGWYRILATQFHCRVAGQFIRLALRDGKAHYLQHLPRVQAYLQAALSEPLLAPFKLWCAEHKLDFTQPLILGENAEHFIAEDAF